LGKRRQKIPLIILFIEVSVVSSPRLILMIDIAWTSFMQRGKNMWISSS
jgi:hypothetical protein